MFKKMNIDLEPEDLNDEMFEKIHFGIKNSKQLDLWVGKEHFRFINQKMIIPNELTISPVEVRLNLMIYNSKVTTKRDLEKTEPYKRLDKIRSAEGKNNLHTVVLDLMRQTDKRNIVFDPFEFDDITGAHNTDYLFTQLQIAAGMNTVTTQMGLLDIPWDYHYDIYIINNKAQVIPISLENQEPLNLARPLRREHNLFKMWRSGGLGEQFL